MRNSLKNILLNYLILHKEMNIDKLNEICSDMGYKVSNGERRMREICRDFPVCAYDKYGKRIVNSSSTIAKWRVIPKNH